MSFIFKCIFSGEDHPWQNGNIIFVTLIHIYRKYHIFMYFLRKIIFHFQSKEKNSYFPKKKKLSFQMIQERSYSSALFFKKTIFSGHLKKISYFLAFFKEISSFIFRLKNKMIFLGKRNIIFPNNTREVIFQCDFFGKTMF